MNTIHCTELRRGFTLIELLVVIAMIAALVTLSGPALRAFNTSQGIRDASAKIMGAMEYARSSAMAYNRYVYMGFADISTPSEPGVAFLLMSTPQGDVMDPANPILQPFNRPQIVKGVSIDDTVKNQYPMVATSGLEPVTNSSFPQINLSVGGRTTSYSRILQFSPDGSVTLFPSGSTRWIHLGLKSARSGNGANSSLLLISGLNGTVENYRP